jgi:transposase
MSRTETINAINGSSEEKRQRARQIQAQIEAKEAELQAILRESGCQQAEIALPSRGIDETEAADLRARLRTFTEDWDRPEAAIYDESPAR